MTEVINQAKDYFRRCSELSNEYEIQKRIDKFTKTSMIMQD